MKKTVAAMKNKTFLRFASAAIAVVLMIGLYVLYQTTHDRIFIEDSLVSTPIITISPSTSGKLQEMEVIEGQTVKKGDPLAVVGSETLHSGTDGLIILANNQSGSTVSPQTQLIQMINPVNMRIAGTLDENKGLNTVRVGQVVSFTVDAFPGKTYWGYVDEISPSAKQTQLSFSISSERPTQQFVVYARFDAEKYPEIKNGMSAKMTVFTKTK